MRVAPQNMDLVTTQVLGLKMVLYRVDALNFIFSLAFLKDEFSEQELTRVGFAKEDIGSQPFFKIAT